MSDVPCSVDDCGRQAWADGLCFGHYKRRQRGKSLSAPPQERGQSAWESLELALTQYQDDCAAAPVGNAAAEMRRIKGRLQKALQRYYARTRRWRRA